MSPEIPKKGAASVLPRRRPENGGIDWSRPAGEIQNLVRALAPPYPGAFTELEGIRIFIREAHLFDTQIHFKGQPGEIVDCFPNGHFIVLAGKHSLYVREFDCQEPSRLVRGTVFKPVSGMPLPFPEV